MITAKNPLNEVCSLYEHFGPDEEKILEYLKECLSDLPHRADDLGDITGAIGYSHDCIEDVIFQVRNVKNWLSTLNGEEHDAIVKGHAKEIGLAKKINVYHRVPGEPTLVGFIFERHGYCSVAIDCDGDLNYSTEFITPHWS